MTRDELIETMARAMPSQERIKRLFEYDDSLGCLRWMRRPIEDFKTAAAHKMWNNKYCGNIAGSFTSTRYIEVMVDGYKHKVHRLIWVYFNGDLTGIETSQIDHIDHNRSNNMIENLRLVNKTQNMQNSSISARNKSGYTGVYWHNIGKKWRAAIRVGTKFKHIGLFDDIQAAVDARKAAGIKFGFHPNHGEQPR